MLEEEEYVSHVDDRLDFLELMAETPIKMKSVLTKRLTIEKNEKLDVHLPKLDLPKFSGEITQFQSLIDTYWSTRSSVSTGVFINTVENRDDIVTGF